ESERVQRCHPEEHRRILESRLPQHDLVTFVEAGQLRGEDEEEGHREDEWGGDLVAEDDQRRQGRDSCGDEIGDGERAALNPLPPPDLRGCRRRKLGGCHSWPPPRERAVAGST